MHRDPRCVNGHGGARCSGTCSSEWTAGRAGRDAIALAAQLADPDGKLTLAHVYVDAASPMHAVTPTFIPTEREISEDMLERERAATGVSAELVSVRSMSPSAGLHQQAAKQGADLIVVGWWRAWDARAGRVGQRHPSRHERCAMPSRDRARRVRDDI